LDELLEAAPPKVLGWMRRKAELADGPGVGQSLCDAGELETCLRRELGDGVEWSQMIAGLLRDLTGDTVRQIAARVGISVPTAARWTRSHHARLAVDNAYAEHATTLAHEALRELHLGERCTAPEQFVSRLRRATRAGGVRQIALAPYNRASR